MATAAATLPRAPIYGIGTYDVDSSPADFEIGWDELDRDTEWAHALLVKAGLGNRLPVRAVIGLGGETVTALTDSEQTLATLLAGVDLVWARTDAVSQLRAQQIEAATYVPLGPALGLGLPGERGARVNGEEWTVFEIRGRLHVTNARPRATRFEEADTGVSGEVAPRGTDYVVVPR